MGFELDPNYNTVPERIGEAKAIYPDGRFKSEILELPVAFADKFIAVKARFLRTPDDPEPGEGLAWEPVPGTTPYTRNSELMNAETSAWGRALIAALIADAKKGVASREEVRNRQDDTAFIDEARLATDRPKVCPVCDSKVFDNRDGNQERIAKGQTPWPAFKCMNKRCTGSDGEPWIAWGADAFDAVKPDRIKPTKKKPDVLPVARDDYGPDEAPF